MKINLHKTLTRFEVFSYQRRMRNRKRIKKASNQERTILFISKKTLVFHFHVKIRTKIKENLIERGIRMDALKKAIALIEGTVENNKLKKEVEEELKAVTVTLKDIVREEGDGNQC